MTNTTTDAELVKIRVMLQEPAYTEAYPWKACIPGLLARLDTAEAQRDDCEDVLRWLASFLQVGGYNAPTVDPETFKQKILDGIEDVRKTAAGEGYRHIEAERDEAVELLRETRDKHDTEAWSRAEAFLARYPGKGEG